ncbi:MAG: RnfABCDGE type electron transport complex subunit G [Bacteroidetes bacterium]|uniref:Ion-translocating oxidoreductase complex subunit G n=1 Tax=Candidatus Merdivivens pullicola TaxID=2840872 RepID=A0A9D9IIW6_9BACT|nr:RnfABCDGE type electron transport complex subunit G [Candidatus Merdivivens pullicola]
MFVSLTVICLVCSALLGGAYAITKDKIDEAEVNKQNEAIARVVPEFDNIPSEEVFEVELEGKKYAVYPAKLSGEVVGYAINTSATGFSGPVVIMVGITAEGRIFNTVPVSHAETPGLGAKISEEGNPFVEQFRDMDPSATVLKVKKDGGDIDAITASTITSRAYTAAVESAWMVFNKIKEEK